MRDGDRNMIPALGRRHAGAYLYYFCAEITVADTEVDCRICGAKFGEEAIFTMSVFRTPHKFDTLGELFDAMETVETLFTKDMCAQCKKHLDMAHYIARDIEIRAEVWGADPNRNERNILITHGLPEKLSGGEGDA